MINFLNLLPDYQKTWFLCDSTLFFLPYSFFLRFCSFCSIRWESFSSADWLSADFPGHSSFSRRSSSSPLEFPLFSRFDKSSDFSRTEEFARMLLSTFLTVAKNPFLKLLQNESKLLLGPVHQGKFISSSSENPASCCFRKFKDSE